jgi:hypothetical protein
MTTAPTFRVSRYDPISDNPDDGMAWITWSSGVPQWKLREALKELRDFGYSDETSIYVEREDPPAPTEAPLSD